MEIEGDKMLLCKTSLSAALVCMASWGREPVPKFHVVEVNFVIYFLSKKFVMGTFFL